MFMGTCEDAFKVENGVWVECLQCAVCGVSGCWPLEVLIDVQADCVIWRDFENGHRRGRTSYCDGQVCQSIRCDYAGFGPFTFDRDARESAKVEPQPNGSNGNAPSPNGNGASPNGHGPAWCPIHQCEMTRYTKGNQSWYSHRTADGWCRGKAKK